MLFADASRPVNSGVRRYLAAEVELEHAKNYFMEESLYRDARLTNHILGFRCRSEAECVKVRDGSVAIGKDSHTVEVLC